MTHFSLTLPSYCLRRVHSTDLLDNRDGDGGDHVVLDRVAGISRSSAHAGELVTPVLVSPSLSLKICEIPHGDTKDTRLTNHLALDYVTGSLARHFALCCTGLPGKSARGAPLEEVFLRLISLYRTLYALCCLAVLVPKELL